MMKATLKVAGLAVAALLATGLPATADTITFSDALSQAQFTVSGGNLVVVLTYTSNTPINNPTDVLTAILFTTTDTTLGTVSALLTPGSNVVNCTAANGCTAPSGGNVGGEWAYNLTGGQFGTNAGIGSAGLNIFGSGNFSGPNLQGPVAVNGLQFGIIGGGTVNFANGDLGNSALINNSVTFTLSGEGCATAAGCFSNVHFIYGTSLDSTVIPEPASILLIGSGLVGAYRLRKRNRSTR